VYEMREIVAAGLRIYDGLLDDFTGHLYAYHKFSLELEPSMLYGICDSCKANALQRGQTIKKKEK
jgi:hypothetical protein